MSTETWNVGRITITLVRESLVPVPLPGLFPDARPDEVIAANRHWLAPHFLNDDGTLPLSIHSFVIEDGAQTIVVDTCIGDRPVPGFDAISNIGPKWLEGFRAAGFDPAAVDVVICTHLHFDHVGWNTMLVDGEWAPTFPNARYLFARNEYEHWASGADGYAFTFSDAVQAVVDAGLADLVETDHRLSDHVSFISTPGHSPGHVSVLLESDGEQAIITGDMVHHPIQIAALDWRMGADDDSVQAASSRRMLFGRVANTPTRLFGTHFAPPTAGWVRGEPEAYRFEADAS